MWAHGTEPLESPGPDRIELATAGRDARWANQDGMHAVDSIAPAAWSTRSTCTVATGGEPAGNSQAAV
jgi:hypothetical protein